MATTRSPESRESLARQGQRPNQSADQQQQGQSTGRDTAANGREAERGIQRTSEPVRGGEARRFGGLVSW
jgi:hypothetical protein